MWHDNNIFVLLSVSETKVLIFSLQVRAVNEFNLRGSWSEAVIIDTPTPNTITNTTLNTTPITTNPPPSSSEIPFWVYIVIAVVVVAVVLLILVVVAVFVSRRYRKKGELFSC